MQQTWRTHLFRYICVRNGLGWFFFIWYLSFKFDITPPWLWYVKKIKVTAIFCCMLLSCRIMHSIWPPDFSVLKECFSKLIRRWGFSRCIINWFDILLLLVVCFIMPMTMDEQCIPPRFSCDTSFYRGILFCLRENFYSVLNFLEAPEERRYLIQVHLCHSISQFIGVLFFFPKPCFILCSIFLRQPWHFIWSSLSHIYSLIMNLPSKYSEKLLSWFFDAMETD